MKLKFPKKIRIDEMVFIVKYDKSDGGGSFSYKNCEIKIGIKDHLKCPTSVLATIIHELKEIIQVNQTVRYDRKDIDSDYLFSYTHKEHTDLCYRLSGLLDYFIK